MENMNTKELTNRINGDIKLLAKEDVELDLFLDYDTGAPKDKICTITKFESVRDYLEYSGEYSEEEMDFFQENGAEFLDYYFECVQIYSGLKYEENPWKNGDYYLVEN